MKSHLLESPLVLADVASLSSEHSVAVARSPADKVFNSAAVCSTVVLHICALLGVHQDAATVSTRNSRWHATYARPAMVMHCLQMTLTTQRHCLAFDGGVGSVFVLAPGRMHPFSPCYGL